MSLKYDIEECPWAWSKELVAAVEDYKNGKRNSKKKIRKFVKREISEHYYNELIKMYDFVYSLNRARRDEELSQKIKDVLSGIVMFVSMLCTICYLIEQNVGFLAFWYFLVYVWATFHSSR